MKKVSLIVIGIAVIFGLIIIVKLFGFYNAIYKKSTIKPTIIPVEKTTFNILLLGYGGEGHDGPYLTDTMMVLHLDLKKKYANLISIPRDLWVKVPTESGAAFHTKINSVYQMGIFYKDYPDLNKKLISKDDPSKLIKYVLKNVTGLSIDNYVALDFNSFIKVVDILGGVDINVTTAFVDPAYPIEGKETEMCGHTEEDIKEFTATESAEMKLWDYFSCRYEKLNFDVGLQNMDGNTALKYVRSRHSIVDGSDFGRDARQQKFLEALKDKVISIGFIPKIIPLMDEMKKRIVTDITTDVIKKFIGDAINASKYKINQLVITDKNFVDDSYSSAGGYILAPKLGIDKWGDLQKGIIILNE